MTDFQVIISGEGFKLIPFVEEWRPIPGADGYEASNLGRIRSIDRMISLKSRWGQAMDRFHPGKILKLKIKPNGYLCFCAPGSCYQIGPQKSPGSGVHRPAIIRKNHD